MSNDIMELWEFLGSIKGEEFETNVTLKGSANMFF